MKVLVAEDDPGLRELVTEILTVWGHTVHAVGDGEEAVRHLDKHASEIELVVTDFQMPRMNGIELTRHVKKVATGIKVIVMSGFSDLGILMEMVEASGADTFIRKPFLIDELQAAIYVAFSKLVSIQQ